MANENKSPDCRKPHCRESKHDGGGRQVKQQERGERAASQMTATHIQANAKPGGDEPDEKNQKE